MTVHVSAARVVAFLDEWAKGKNRDPEVIHGFHPNDARESNLLVSDLRALARLASAEPDRAEGEIIWTQRGAGVDGDPLRATAGLGDMTAEVLLSRGTGLWNVRGSHIDGRLGLKTQADGRDYAEVAMRVRAKERIASAQSCLAAPPTPAVEGEGDRFYAVKGAIERAMQDERDGKPCGCIIEAGCEARGYDDPSYAASGFIWAAADAALRASLSSPSQEQAGAVAWTEDMERERREADYERGFRHGKEAAHPQQQGAVEAARTALERATAYRNGEGVLKYTLLWSDYDEALAALSTSAKEPGQ